MALSEQVWPRMRPAVQAFLDDRIVQIVGERCGVKETDLTDDIISDVLDRSHVADPVIEGISVETIFMEIHQLIQCGRIIGVHCEIGDSGYTFLVPAGTRLQIAMPIQDIRTKH